MGEKARERTVRVWEVGIVERREKRYEGVEEEEVGGEGAGSDPRGGGRSEEVEVEEEEAGEYE